MMSEITRVAIQAPFTIAMKSSMSQLQYYNIAKGLLSDFDRVTAERDALQARLTVADQTIDDLKHAAPACCTPTEEEKALLVAGDYTPEELWGGSRPTCPKCIDAAAPPAGGEPEVVSHAAASFAGWLMMNREGHTVYEESLQGWLSEFLESDDYKLEVSADRAHTARLQAEVEKYKFQSRCHLQRARLAESELTKARELLSEVNRNVFFGNWARAKGDRPAMLTLKRIREFMMQSAPAAKD
jgi:hypothetical protein